MKLSNLHMLIKQSLSLPRNLALGTFGELVLIVFSTKVNLQYVLLDAVFCIFQKKLIAESFSKNSNLDYLGISLPVFSSRNNLKLHNIYSQGN